MYQLKFSPGQNRQNLDKLICLTPPDVNCVKLNTDGTMRDAEKNTVAERLIEDCRGSWLAGFAVNIGRGSVLLAELWGI